MMPRLFPFQAFGQRTFIVQFLCRQNTLAKFIAHHAVLHTVENV